MTAISEAVHLILLRALILRLDPILHRARIRHLGLADPPRAVRPFLPGPRALLPVPLQAPREVPPPGAHPRLPPPAPPIPEALKKSNSGSISY